jgi:outer membrane protein assembly factor BamB
VVYATGWLGDATAPRRTLVVDLATGEPVARVDDLVATVVRRDDGSPEGLLVVQPEVRLLELDGRVRWSAGAIAGGDESAAALARGDRIYVAIYSASATGSALYALDRATGLVVWKGDVAGLLIAHSIYTNEVTLAFAPGDRLVLRGEEAGTRTFQIFAAGTGERLLADSRYRE